MTLALLFSQEPNYFKIPHYSSVLRTLELTLVLLLCLFGQKSFLPLELTFANTHSKNWGFLFLNLERQLNIQTSFLFFFPFSLSFYLVPPTVEALGLRSLFIHLPWFQLIIHVCIYSINITDTVYEYVPSDSRVVALP